MGAVKDSWLVLLDQISTLEANVLLGFFISPQQHFQLEAEWHAGHFLYICTVHKLQYDVYLIL